MSRVVFFATRRDRTGDECPSNTSQRFKLESSEQGRAWIQCVQSTLEAEKDAGWLPRNAGGPEGGHAMPDDEQLNSSGVIPAVGTDGHLRTATPYSSKHIEDRQVDRVYSHK